MTHTQAPVKERKFPLQTRISPATRKAIKLVIREGKQWGEAAEIAGVTYGAIWKAKQRPAVKQFIADEKAAFIQEVEEMRAPYKARAMEVANNLMHNANSEAVKARMVEFLAGESKNNGVNIQINNNNSTSAGYEYARPGQEIVTIRRAGDSQSPADTVQDVEIIDD